MQLPHLFRIVRFVISGSIAAAGNISVLFILVHFFEMYYLYASICSFFASLGLGFTLQKFWTFRNQSFKGTHVQLVRYAAITTTNLGINTALMYLFVTILGVWYIFAQALAGMIIAVIAYIGHGSLVFTNENVGTSSHDAFPSDNEKILTNRGR